MSGSRPSCAARAERASRSQGSSDTVSGGFLLLVIGLADHSRRWTCSSKSRAQIRRRGGVAQPAAYGGRDTVGGGMIAVGVAAAAGAGGASVFPDHSFRTGSPVRRLAMPEPDTRLPAI